MRQFLVLGLLAVVGWLLFDKYFAKPAVASGGGAPSDVVSAEGGAKADPLLGDLLGAGAPTSNPSSANPSSANPSSASPSAGGGPNPAVGEVAANPRAGSPLEAADRSKVQRAFEELLGRVQRGEAKAIGQAWKVLTNTALAAPMQQQLGEALTPPDGSDFARQLKLLGPHNAFVHSSRGRNQAQVALAAALSLPDPEAVAAGSQLLGLCLRGSIDKGHRDARAFVDAAFQKYRVRADRWLCSSANVAGARSYTIASGDNLNAIARKFRRQEKLNVEEGTLAVLNGISNKNSIRAGQRIKIPVDPVHAVIEKRSYSLAVYVGPSLLRLYWVGHGKGDKTPVTRFAVDSKIPHPPWTAPDGNVYPYGHPKNILGEYWIGLKGDHHGFGIHGTPHPDTICTMSSDGCIRMRAPDIADLFELLPREATVEIRASEAQ